MLFKLANDLSELLPLAFSDFTRFQKREKHLEELLSGHLFDVLFEGAPLLAFHQERSYQPEGDIYSLNCAGELVIFELKVATASDDALDQLFRYAQRAGQWQYPEIDRKFRAYPKQTYGNCDIAKAHQDAFGLTEPLKPEDFNRTQHLVVVGSAADAGLVRAVEFWKRKNLPIDFCPYRIFEINGEPYFEFFAKPYDAHTNPGQMKGVLFDTCRTYYPNGLKWMIEKRRVSAFGDRKDAVNSLSKGDVVFYSHVGVGLVAAARITGNRVKSDSATGTDELYWEVQFLSPVPTQFDPVPRSMSFARVKEVTGKNFFWARIQKVPYLTAEEAENLSTELSKCLADEKESVTE